MRGVEGPVRGRGVQLEGCGTGGEQMGGKVSLLIVAVAEPSCTCGSAKRAARSMSRDTVT